VKRMSAVRSKVNVYDACGKKTGSADMPAVFSVMHRPDVVEAVAQRATLSTRNPYAVKNEAGYGTAAQSWGTGRAVARVPRVPGGGSHRSGQAAFANFCRGGGMFAPTQTYRRWARQTNQTERRHAVAFALSAAGCTSLVFARGHKAEKVPELPLVVDNAVEEFARTKEMHNFLVNLGCGDDLTRCVDNKKVRPGSGKSRNRKYKTPVGPLVVVTNAEKAGKAGRAIPGVTVANVENLNVRQLAPGGKGGRLTIFSEAAFKKLDAIFGGADGVSMQKAGYKLPRSVTSGNVSKIMSSEQIQNVIRPAMTPTLKPFNKVNPLRNKKAMAEITPKYEEIMKVAAKRMK